jgi:hypothetical protein
LFATGAGRSQAAPQSRQGQLRVGGFGVVDFAAWRACPRHVAVERGRTHDEVAGWVVSGVDQCFEDVVVAPVLQIAGQVQVGAGLGEAAPEKALGPHVVEKPGQAFMKRAAPVVFFHPEAIARKRDQGSKRAGLAAGLDFNDGDASAKPFHAAWQHIALRARRAHPDHSAAGQQWPQGARDGGLAHAERGLHLGAGGVPAGPAQGAQQGSLKIGFHGI